MLVVAYEKKTAVWTCVKTCGGGVSVGDKRNPSAKFARIPRVGHPHSEHQCAYHNCYQSRQAAAADKQTDRVKFAELAAAVGKQTGRVSNLHWLVVVPTATLMNPSTVNGAVGNENGLAMAYCVVVPPGRWKATAGGVDVVAQLDLGAPSAGRPPWTTKLARCVPES